MRHSFLIEPICTTTSSGARALLFLSIATSDLLLMSSAPDIFVWSCESVPKRTPPTILNSSLYIVLILTEYQQLDSRICEHTFIGNIYKSIERAGCCATLLPELVVLRWRVMDHLIALLMIIAILTPIFGIVPLYLFKDHKKTRNIFFMIVPAALLADILFCRYFYYDFLGPSPLSTARHISVDIWSSGLAIRIAAEPLGLLFALLASMLWLPNMLYSIGYLDANNEENQTKFFCMISLSMAATLGIAFSGNLITLLMFYEILTICTYPLIMHSSKATRIGRLYMLELMATSVTLLLLLIILVLQQTDASFGQFRAGGLMTTEQLRNIGAVALLLCSFGIAKAALFPVNAWLPAAMVAPAPVSSFLHAVAVVKSGVFAIIKIIVYIFGVDNARTLFYKQYHVFVSGTFLSFVACITIIVATIYALRSTELKKIMAYSTIANLSYIVGSAGLFSGSSIVVSLFQMVAHGCAKITLFFVVGSIYTVSKLTSYKDLTGMARQMPITMTCFAIAASSIVGLPFTGGYKAKLGLISGGAESANIALLTCIMLSSVASSVYLSRILVTSCQVTHDRGVLYEAPKSMLCAMILTTTATVGVYFFANFFTIVYD